MCYNEIQKFQSSKTILESNFFENKNYCEVNEVTQKYCFENISGNMICYLIIPINLRANMKK